MNLIQTQIINEIEVNLKKYNYFDGTTYDRDVVYELSSKAIIQHVPYDTIIETSEKIKRQCQLIQLYFMFMPLKEFKNKKEFFLDNKENPSFISLLFLADKDHEKQNKSIEKAKLLIEWGYDIHATLDKPYIGNFSCFFYDYIEVGLTLLHYATSKPFIDFLIEEGANLEAKAHCAKSYSIKQLVDSGVLQIKTQAHWEEFLKFEKQNSYYIDGHYDMEELKKRNKQPNTHLSLYQKTLTPLELAKYYQQKGKVVILEKAMLTKPHEVVDKILSLMEKKEYKKATRLFNLQVKIENEALFERLSEFKTLVDKINTQENIISQLVIHQKIEWFKKATQLQMTQNNYTNYPFLLLATQQRKTFMFIHLYENGYQKDIDLVLAYINEKVKYYQNSPLENSQNHDLPLLIIKYLMNEDYIFEHKYFIEKAIEKEQDRLNLILEKDTQEAKRRKI